MRWVLGAVLALTTAPIARGSIGASTDSVSWPHWQWNGVHAYGGLVHRNIIHPDSFHIFKGKLQATANNAADLRTLSHLYEPIIRSRINEPDAYTVGIAMKRYEELISLFQHLGL